MAGCPNPHSVKLPDGTEKKFENEIEFKKYLAEGGLLDLQKAKLIDINLDFLKDFFVPEKKVSIKSTIKKSTGAKNAPKQTPLRQARKEGKYEGELNVTEKLSKKIEEGKQKLIDLRDTIKEKFAEYNKFKTEKSKKDLADARERFKSKLDEQRELSKQVSKEKIADLKIRAKEAVLNIKEKGQSLIDITDGLRAEIKQQLKDAKSGVFKGAKIKGLNAQRMLNKVNNAKTPLQLLSAIDYVERSIKDIDYGNKVNKSIQLSAEVKKAFKSAPLNVRLSLKQLATVKPREIADVDAYNKILTDAINFLKQKDIVDINTSEVDALTESITKKNLKYKIELAEELLVNRLTADEIAEIKDKRNTALKLATTPQEKAKIIDDYNKQISDLKESVMSKIKKPMASSIADMESSLEDLKNEVDLTNVEEITTAENGNKRDALESINEVLKQDIADFDKSSVDPKDLKFIESLENIDISKLSDKQLSFLNYAINNLVENGRLDGVGKLYNKYRVAKEFTPENIDFIKSGVLKINSLKEKIWDRASLDTQLNLIFSNEEFIAKLRTITGMGDWFNAYGSHNGYFGQTNKNLTEVFDVVKDTKIIESPESQIKIGAIIDITQYENGLTPTEILAEFEGRKEAMAESIRRGKEAMSVENWKKENGDYVDMVELVYNKYIKDADSPSDLLSKLTNNEKKVKDLIIKKYADITEGQRRNSEIYENKKFKDVVNYSARTYIPTTVAEVSESFADGFGQLPPSIQNTPGLGNSQSSSFEERLLKGKQVRKNAILNYNILDSFQREYRRQMYDLFTYDKRQYTAQAITSPEILKSFNNDAFILSKIQNSINNRYLNEISGLQSAKDNGGLASDIIDLVKKNAIRSALGGVGIPYIKQYAPTMASVIVNTSDNPALFLTSASDLMRHGDAFKKLISQSPVSQRHEQEIFTTGGIVSAKDMKELSSVLRKKIKGLDKFSDIYLMSALKSGDLSSAGLAWVTYYKKSLLLQGKIKGVGEFDIVKESNNPNMEAMQYAEQMTSTTLNVNEAVNKPKDQTLPLLGKNLPFTTFAVNSKVNLFSNLGKIIETNGVISARDRLIALQRVGAHVAESATINYVGWMMRTIAVSGSYQLFSYALNNSNMDEELKDKARDILTNTFKTILESNDKNSTNYFVNDLIFGQIGETIAKPILKSTKSVATDIYLSSIGQQKEKTKYEYVNDAAPALAFFGSGGMAVSNALTLGKNAADLLTYNNDSLFRMNKFGFIDALDEKKIPLDEQNTTVPAFNKYMQSAAVISNALSLFTGSPKELQIFTSRIPQVNKKLINEMYGTDKIIQSEKEKYALLETKEYNGKKYYLKDKFSVVNFMNNEYVLTIEQLEERKKVKAQLLSTIYTKMMDGYMKGITSQRNVYREKIKEDPKYSFLKKQADLMKYPDKFTNDQITDIVNEISKNYIISKYQNKLTPIKDVEQKK
jgi:hypothetical protein